MLAVACGRWCSSACRSRASRCFSDSCHVLKPLAVVWVRPNCCAVWCVPMRELNVGLWTRCAKPVPWAVAMSTTPWFAMVLAAPITSWGAPPCNRGSDPELVRRAGRAVQAPGTNFAVLRRALAGSPSGKACLLFDALASGVVKHRHVADHTAVAEGRGILQSVSVRPLDEADQGEDRDCAGRRAGSAGSSLAPGFPGVASVCSVARAPCCPVARLPAAGLQEAHAAPRHIKRGRDRFVGVAAKARPQTFRWT